MKITPATVYLAATQHAALKAYCLAHDLKFSEVFRRALVAYIPGFPTVEVTTSGARLIEVPKP